jgi:two-component system cell cycle response regulator DivK
MEAHVLIVEDDAASRELLRYLFAAYGYRVTVAGDGAEGTQRALAEDPDLILCDLRMPKMDGYGVAKALQSSPSWRRVPLIAVTAFSMPGDRERALAAGFAAYFSKPIVPETFVREIEQFLPPALLAGIAPFET